MRNDLVAFSLLTQNVRFILENAPLFKWDVQGFGLLRMRINKNLRLHIWDSRLKYPGSHTIHDHLQWGLRSTIIHGELLNTVYNLENSGERTHYIGRIVAGIGGSAESIQQKQPVTLVTAHETNYSRGDSYSLNPTTIHETNARDGTVTLMEQSRTQSNSAHVFWPIADEDWVGAWPRPATYTEIAMVVAPVLEKFNEA